MMLEREDPIVQEIRDARDTLSYYKQEYLRIKDFAPADRVKQAKEDWDNAKDVWKALNNRRRKERGY